MLSSLVFHGNDLFGHFYHPGQSDTKLCKIMQSAKICKFLDWTSFMNIIISPLFVETAERQLEKRLFQPQPPNLTTSQPPISQPPTLTQALHHSAQIFE